MLEIRKAAGALGAEVGGIDLRRAPSPQSILEIRQAFLEHLVIFFRDQHLTLDEFMSFARALGRPIEYPFVKGLPGYPEIIQVAKYEDERVNFGGIWHSDTTYLQSPPMGTLLLAREIPLFGGDTLFANQYLAFETLSEGMQRMLAGLRAVSSSTKADITKTREDRIKTEGRELERAEYVAEHPVVRTHPETGRRSLFVNLGHTVRFAGMTAEESTPILGYLFEHQVRPEFTFRLQWQEGTLVFWDNRCTLHNPINDYHGLRRIMHRITLAGDSPV